MNSQQEILLREYGLKEKEIKIILQLVQSKELTAYKISKLTGIHRSTTYDLLEKLIEKGFITKIQENKPTKYKSNDMSSIISHLKDKENILSSLIPIFEEIKKEDSQLIKIYQKGSGQKEFLYRLFQLAEKRLVNFHYILGNEPSQVISSNLFIDQLTKEYTKKGLKKIIDYKGIWNENLKKTNTLKTFNLIGPNKFLKELPSKATIMIYGEYLAFAYTENYPTIIEIHNSLVAKEMKFLFEFLWKIAKK